MYKTSIFHTRTEFLNQCRVCRYCDTPSYFQSRINHKHFVIHIQSEIEQNKRKLNRTKMYRGRDRINLTEKLDLYDDGNVL